MMLLLLLFSSAVDAVDCSTMMLLLFVFVCGSLRRGFGESGRMGAGGGSRSPLHSCLHSSIRSCARAAVDAVAS